MNYIEHPAKTPSQRTGIFATHHGLLHPTGSSAPANAPRRAHATAATFLGLALLFAGLVLPSGASAALTYPHLGQISGPRPGERFRRLFSESVAVNDKNGHIYVADSGEAPGTAGLVYDFASAADTSPEVWDGSNTPAGSFGVGTTHASARVAVAVDNTSGDVYVADSFHKAIDKFDQNGNLIASFGDSEPSPNGQLSGLKTPAKSFSPPGLGSFGIAVDQATHNLYAIDAGHKVIDVFDENGAYLEQITATPAGLYSIYTDGIAVNATSGHLFVSEAGTEQAFEFDSFGAFLTAWNGNDKPLNPGSHTPAGGFPGYDPLAVNDTSGDVYIASTYPEGFVNQFDSTGKYLSRIEGTPGGRGGAGLTVDQATGDLYVSDNSSGTVKIFGPEAVLLPTVATEAPSGVGPHTATLNGTVDPEAVSVTDCHFDYIEAAHYQAAAFNPYAGGQSAPCVPAPGSGPSPVAVQADLGGLKAGLTYHFRLVATNANGTESGADESFETPPPPQVVATASENLTETSVDLSAEVNPKGAETSCVIEYGETTEPDNPAVPYQQTEPCNPSSLGTGNSPVPVSLHLEGLVKGTTYHWRVAATNPSGTTDSPDQTFVYLTPEPPPPGSCPANEAFRTGPSAALPDCRAYEQVTPTTKNGSLIGAVILGFPPDFAAGGSRLVLSSVACFGGSLSCPVNRGLVGASFAFQRTAAGWSTTPLSPPATQLGPSSTWRVGAEQGNAIYSAPTPPSGEDHAYLRRPDGSFVDIGPASPPAAGPQGPIGSQSNDSSASTADLSHYVFGLNAPVWPFDETTGILSLPVSSRSLDTLYEYVGTGNTQPLLVGVTGGYEEGKNHNLVSTCGTDLGTASHFTNPGALSGDGSVVFFTAIGSKGCVGSGANAATEVPANTLYARVDGETEGKAHTLSISQPQCGAGPGADEVACRTAPPADAEFQGGAEDGSLAYFTSTQQLTDNASEDSHQGDSAYFGRCSVTSGPNGCNLYLYDFKRPEGQRLIDVSAGDTSGKGPQVQGVMALSNDGSHVYFVAKGVLAANPGAATDPASGQPQKAEAGAENLYLYDTAGAQTTFIATLPASDDVQGIRGSEWSSGPQQANLTPEGRYLVFTSHAALTPDTAPTGVSQVFRYDAQAKALIRLSVGERGFNDNGNSPAETLCNERNCSDAATIALPGDFFFFAGPPRRDPTMSHDGARVFFTSPLALTPGALDDIPVGSTEAEGSLPSRPIYAQNLYQWEAQGTGSCEEAGGCVRLLSDGRDTTLSLSATCSVASAVCFVGASASGKDAFFTSADRLAPTDTDTQVDYYDARVGGGFAESANIVPCQGDACPTGTTQPSPAQTHGTEHFEAPPEKFCKKGFVLKGGKCVKKHVRKHHKRRHHHKRAGANRRAGR